MNRRNRTLLAGGIAAVALLAVLFALLRPNDTAVSPPTTVTPAAAAIEVAVLDGRPIGGIRRVTVRKGETAELRVTGAPGETVHVHGYDRTLELGADGAGTIAFDATLQGVFEVELEGAGVQIAALTVR